MMYFTIENEQACLIPESNDQYAVTESGKVYSMRYNRQLKTRITEHGYEVIRLPFRMTATHKLVAICFVPNPDNKPQVDHIDRNKQNIHYTNLRWVDVQTNSKNRNIRKDSKTGFIGVAKRDSGFISRISIDGIQKYLGYFNTSEQAAQAYDKEAKKHGYTVLNFDQGVMN